MPARAQRKALSQTAGPVVTAGDPALSKALGRALVSPPEDDGRVGTHRFHAWPARMHPYTAAFLLRELAPPGPVLDPFMGGGTVPVEAMLAGRECYGRDVNPVALEVAWARTRLWSAERLDAFEGAADRAVERARALPSGGSETADAFLRRERAWYDPPALLEVSALARATNEEDDPGLRRMLRACLSSILVKASRQASDSVVVPDRDHRFVPKGRVLEWFRLRVFEHRESLAWLSREAGPGAPKPRLSLRDAREPEPGLRGRIAAVVTSPPYPGVYDYAAHHRRRYEALGLDAREAEAKEIGARREVRERGADAAVRRFEDDLALVFAAWREALVPGGLAFVVLGDGEHPGGVVRSVPLVEAAAARSSLRVTARASVRRSVRGPGRRQAREAGREEHLVLLEVTP